MGYDKTIIVIEDSKPLNRILCFDLEKAGFKTVSAFNGKDGFEKTVEIKPNLVLLDINIPLMNGFEVAGRLNPTRILKTCR